MAAIGSAHRLALDRAVIGEVVEGHPSAVLAHRRDDFFGDRPLVEAIRPLRRNAVERRGEIVERDVIAGDARAEVGPEIDSRGRRMQGELLPPERQRIRDVVIDRQTLMRELGRGGYEIGERKFAGAVFAPGELQSRDRAGNADRKAAVARFERVRFAVGVEKHVPGRQRRGRFAIVDRDRLMPIRAMDQHEAAAADISRAGQRHCQREADRDRRVHGIAAAPQDIEPDARSHGLLAHHHAVLGDHRARSGEIGDDRRGLGARGERDKDGDRGEVNDGDAHRAGLALWEA